MTSMIPSTIKQYGEFYEVISKRVDAFVLEG